MQLPTTTPLHHVMHINLPSNTVKQFYSSHHATTLPHQVTMHLHSPFLQRPMPPCNPTVTMSLPSPCNPNTIQNHHKIVSLRQPPMRLPKQPHSSLQNTSIMRLSPSCYTSPPRLQEKKHAPPSHHRNHPHHLHSNWRHCSILFHPTLIQFRLMVYGQVISSDVELQVGSNFASNLA